MKNSKQVVEQLLADADIRVNGDRPFDVQVHDERVYRRILTQGSLGVGEAYMDGWWTAERVDETVARLLSEDLRGKLTLNPVMVRTALAATLANRQSISRAYKNASAHYDIGNDLYQAMLDKRMIYSCGFWRDAKNLDEAQEAKLDRICRKLYLQPGMTVLDIGCGWGGFARYAAEKYGVRVTGITPAAEQVALAKQRTAGLDVTILQQDYRQAAGSFDRVVSIGMLEHVGPKNYRDFFRKCEALLKQDGLALHHCIGVLRSAHTTDPWINKYIFPGGVVPSLTQIAKATERLLIIEDVENFGPYYDTTLLAWHANFVRNWPKLQSRYDERFYRMWDYYLLMFAGAFRARHLQLWQIVMRKRGPSAVYRGVR